MRRKLAATVVSLGIAATAVMPSAVFAEEVTTEEAVVTEAELETEGELETEAETEAEGFDYSEGYNERGLFEGITAGDYVTLPEYTGVRLASDAIVAESEIETLMEEQINSIVAQFTTQEEVKEGVVEDGDTLNIDFVGSIDGVEFEGGSTQGQGTEVTIGVTQFIDDFLDQLIGHEVGETINVEVTFPEKYDRNPDLQNKDAVFVTTINSVIETVVPEFDDAFVKENLEAESVEEYRQSLHDEIYKSYVLSALLQYLFENAEISEVPESAVNTIYNYQYEYLNNVYAPYGMDAEAVLSYQGMTTDDLVALCEESAGQMLAMQAIMEEAGLEVTKELVMEVTGATDDDYETLLEVYGSGYVNNCLIPDCVARFMYESVEIYEAEIETEAETETELETEVETEGELETEEASTEA